MAMAFCCNQMQLWRESDQNCVRMQFSTKNENQTLSGEAKLLLGFHWFLSLTPGKSSTDTLTHLFESITHRGNKANLIEYQVHEQNTNLSQNVFSALFLLMTITTNLVFKGYGKSTNYST